MRPPQRRRNSSWRWEEAATLLVVSANRQRNVQAIKPVCDRSGRALSVPPQCSAAARPRLLLAPLQVFAGLLLLFRGYRAFHRRAAERADALQQLRAAKAGLASGAGGITGGGGLGGIGRRGGLIEINGLEEVGGSGGAHLDALQQDDGWDADSSGTARDRDPSAAGAGAGAAAAAGPPPPELLRFCEEHFGLEWVRRWGAAAQQVCSAQRQLAAEAGAAPGSSGASTVTCRRISDSHLPPKSAPHVLCDAINLRLDPTKLVRVKTSLQQVHAGRSRLLPSTHPCAVAALPVNPPCSRCCHLPHAAAPSTVPSPPPRLHVPLPDVPPLPTGGLGGQLLMAGLPAGRLQQGPPAGKAEGVGLPAVCGCTGGGGLSRRGGHFAGSWQP